MKIGSFEIFIILMIGIPSILVIAAMIREKKEAKREMVCRDCGHVGPAKQLSKGSALVEIILWLLMVLPGILYSVWRLTTRYKGCPVCLGHKMIPVDSPAGRRLI